VSNKHGSKWIRPAKRARVYARDKFCCVWCQTHVLPGAPPGWPRSATLDHVVPRDAGGSNHVSNLVTACHSCNSRRHHASAIEFAFTEAARTACFTDYTGPIARATLERLIAAMGKELPK
jgi:5-methylcytosine-specific restriction endonuclease McrA